MPHNSSRFGVPPPTPNWRIILYSLSVCLCVVFVSLLMQETIYKDLLHDEGPLRIIGTVIAALLAFAFVLKYQLDVRERQERNLRRFRVIAEMNDRIRNAVQALACMRYLSDAGSTDAIREAVNTIDTTLQGLLVDPAMTDPSKKSAGPIPDDAAKSYRA